jgi:hypothetical protein
MREFPTRLSINPPLLGALVVALSLHGLFLSWQHMRQRPQPRPVPLRLRDNTPVLLEVSSLPQPPTGLDGFRLPKATQLPPPPTVLPAPVQSRSKRLFSPSSVGHASQKLRSQAVKTKQSPRLVTTNNKSKDSKQSRSSHSASIVFSAEGLSEAVEHLKRLSTRRDGQEAASGSLNSTSLLRQSLDHSLGVVKTIESRDEKNYLNLWNQGRFVPLPKQSQLLGAEKPLEAREITLANIRSQDVGLRHAELVRLHDRMFLFWLHGEKIFLLMALTPPLFQP